MVIEALLGRQYTMANGMGATLVPWTLGAGMIDNQFLDTTM